ncbi:MAG: DUF3048 domain-containing protein [Chloroflexi bacterium]|nr:DUF3048 domain-containing protein [Chloroflexota bacterium]
MRCVSIVTACLLLLSACAPATNSTPLPGVHAEIIEAPAADVSAAPSAINPLTGLPVAAAALERRPIVVKISNAPALVRPQAGIGAADLVYEHYTEGGLTRFSAVFYGQSPQRVGSIRSARLIDDQLVPMYNALLAFSGASTGVEQILYGADYAPRTYKGVLYGAPYYWRDGGIAAPHNMFLNLAALWSLAAQEGFNARVDLSGMIFSATTPPNSGGTVNNIDVRFIATRAQWTYDAVSGLYLRYSDGLPHADANTGAQITAANVVILYAPHSETSIVESVWNDIPSYSIAINLLGAGAAVLFRDGQRYECRWTRPTRESRLTLVTPDGQPLAFRPGVTWFEVVRPPEAMIPDSEWTRWG